MRSGFLLILLSIFVLFSCRKSEVEHPDETQLYFLSEIRPKFFESINFNSKEKIGDIPQFLKDFSKMYSNLETDYAKGNFKSSSDLNNVRLAGMYYSFGITAIVRAYLDGFIKFEDIIGSSETGLFSGQVVSAPDFRQAELQAMMRKSEKVARFAMYVNGFNDKTYATFMVSRQISQRVKDPNHFNNVATQDSMIAYLDSKIYNYELFKDWNTLMSQLSFTNYNDSLNTFQNPRMEINLKNINAKLKVGAIPDLNGRYPEILGPVFRFDLNLKKIDFLLQCQETLNMDQLNEISQYIAVIDTLGDYVVNTKKKLLDSWEYKETITERINKLAEVKQYVESEKLGKGTVGKPALKPFFISKNYLQAYQCYNCHRPVNF